jgi:hypothetical protein
MNGEMEINVPTVAPTLHTLAPLEGLGVRFAESAQTRFGIDLRGGDALVSEELLDMIERHAGIEEDRGDAGPQAVRRDLLRDPGLRGRLNRLTARDLRALTPLKWLHINPYGTFTLDMHQRLPLDLVA